MKRFPPHVSSVSSVSVNWKLTRNLITRLSLRKETVRLQCAVPTSEKFTVQLFSHSILDTTSFGSTVCCRNQGRYSVQQQEGQFKPIF